MRKFNFRLEPILRYKSQVEDQKRRDLAGNIEDFTAHKNVLLEMTARRQKYLYEYFSQLKGRINVTGLKMSSRFLDKLNRDMVLQAKKVIECEKKVERARASLLEAMRDRKRYENLRNRKLKAYVKAAATGDQKKLDEHSSQAAVRRSSNAITA